MKQGVSRFSESHQGRRAVGADFYSFPRYTYMAHTPEQVHPPTPILPQQHQIKTKPSALPVTLMLLSKYLPSLVQDKIKGILCGLFVLFCFVLFFKQGLPYPRLVSNLTWIFPRVFYTSPPGDGTIWGGLAGGIKPLGVGEVGVGESSLFHVCG
jgi:hypothetical protein